MANSITTLSRCAQGRARYTRGAGALVYALTLAAPASANPVNVSAEQYFVQPIYYFGAEHVNALASDGATSDGQSYYNAPDGVESDVSLDDGTLKGFVEVGNTTYGSSQGRMGETLTFMSGAGTDVDFELAVDGSIISDAITPALNATSQIRVDAYIAVYDANVDVDSTNWACFLFNCSSIVPPSSGPLGSDRFLLDLNDSATDIDMLIDEVLSTTVTLASNTQALKVFGNLTLWGNRTSNPGITTLDFLNTATFGVTTAPNVSYSSASGVFPGAIQVAAVPLPAGAVMLLSGLFALLGFRRRGA